MGKTEVETGQFVVVGCAEFIEEHRTNSGRADDHSVVGMDSFGDYYPRKINKGDSVQARKHAFLKSPRDA
ncbi:MAG TPA: hypothetical protein VIL51_11375 [Thermoleophilia bacterium]